MSFLATCWQVACLPLPNNPHTLSLPHTHTHKYTDAECLMGTFSLPCTHTFSLPCTHTNTQGLLFFPATKEGEFDERLEHQVPPLPPFAFTRDPCIWKRASCIRKRALCFQKRALCVLKRALHILKRALYRKEPLCCPPLF